MDLAQDALALEQLIFEEGGELSETLERWLAEVETNLTVKVDSYHFAMQRFESTAEMLKKRASQITTAARALENVQERLKDRIKLAMQTIGTDEVKGTEFRFKLARGKERVIIDEKQVSPEFFSEKTVVVRELNRDKLVEAAKATPEGQAYPAGIRFEPAFQLRPYVNK